MTTPDVQPTGRVVLREEVTPWDTFEHVAESVLADVTTKFQHVQLLRTRAFGTVLVLDGICQSSSVDEFIYHETIVHPAMAAFGNPKQVLVLGGAEGATIREVLRWPSVEQVTMVDIDEELVALCRELLPDWAEGAFEDSRTRLALGDAVAFLRDGDERFDVIIADMSDPVEDGPATFCFTKEFFESVQRRLTVGGVFVLQAGPASPAELLLHAKVLRTLATVFADVDSYLCPATIYGRPLGLAMASDSPIFDRLQRAGNNAAALPVADTWRYLTAQTLAGHLGIPGYLRSEIAASSEIYRDAAPPLTDSAGAWAFTDAGRTDD